MAPEDARHKETARRRSLLKSIRNSPHYTFALLYVISVISYLDRQLIALLGADIQKELGLQDWQLGFVSGTAFALLYGAVGIPLSIVADRANRVRLLSVCLVAWSALTAVCGLAVNFTQLSLARVGVAVGEAGAYPASLSMIGDLYPARSRSTVTSIFFSATAAGTLISFIVGGVLADHFGWRMTFILAAIPGILVAVLLWLTAPEPKRGAMDGMVKPQAQPILATFPMLMKIKVYSRIIVSFAMTSFVLFSLLAWMPVYAIRKFELGTGMTGLGIGLSLGFMSAAVQIIGGILADRATRKSAAAPIRIAGWAQVLCIPFIVGALFSDSFVLFCILFAIGNGFASTSGPLSLAAIQSVVPVNVRATAAAIILLSGILCGFGFGPTVVGAISDLLRTTDATASLRTALLFPLIGAVISAGILWILGRSGGAMDQAVAARRAEDEAAAEALV